MTFNRGLLVGALVVIALSVRDGALGVAFMSSAVALMLLTAERGSPRA